MNPYDILGISPSATLEEITLKYKSLAQKHHPDKGGDEEVFKQIKLAYEILSDPERRQRYDSTGEVKEAIPIMQEALDQICRIFLGLVPTVAPEHDNIIVKLKIEIRNLRSLVASDIKKANEFAIKLEKIIKRIKRKKDGENIIKSFAESQLQNVQRDLVMFQRRLQIVELMQKIIEDYEYGTDEELIAKLAQAASGNVA